MPPRRRYRDWPHAFPFFNLTERGRFARPRRGTPARLPLVELCARFFQGAHGRGTRRFRRRPVRRRFPRSSEPRRRSQSRTRGDRRWDRRLRRHGHGSPRVDSSRKGKTGEAPRHYYACGPSPMLSALRDFTEKEGSPAHVSVEQWMACGVGACHGCVLPSSRGGYVRACADGPVFAIGDIVWKK